MLSLDLAGTWDLIEVGGDRQRTGTVPGCVHLDLLAVGELPDLWYRDNEEQYRWVEIRDWTYARRFIADAALLACDALELVCEGLHTFAAVTVNGTEVLSADNMFRTWRADLRAVLVAGENLIEVTFRSPIPYMQERDAERRLPAWNCYHEDYRGKSYVRKMACSFGWDWGPMAPTAGIWRAIRIEGYTAARFADVRLHQQHHDGAVTLAVRAQVQQLADSDCSIRASISHAGTVVAQASGDAGCDLHVDQPALWWPNGLGEQPLYDVVVELVDAAGQVCDRWQRRTGLRTIELVREQDEWGESFAFALHVVPEHAIVGRVGFNEVRTAQQRQLFMQ